MTWKRYPLKLYFKRLSASGFFGLGLLINIGIWIFLWWNIPRGLDQVFLQYNILFDVVLSGPPGHIFYVPFYGLLILLVNATLGWIYYQKDAFVAGLFD